MRRTLRATIRGITYVIASLLVRFRAENVPDLAHLGPVVLAPNHCSYLDPVVLQMSTRVHLNFLMTETIFRIRWIRWFFELWGAIPLPEQGSAAGAMKRALRVMRSGRPVVIYPEGRISDDGFLNEGRGGVVTLLMRARVPVIPVAILGTFGRLPRGARFIRPGPVTVRFGHPMAPPGRDDDEDAYLERLMREIHLLGVPQRPESVA